MQKEMAERAIRVFDDPQMRLNVFSAKVLLRLIQR